MKLFRPEIPFIGLAISLLLTACASYSDPLAGVPQQRPAQQAEAAQTAPASPAQASTNFDDAPDRADILATVDIFFEALANKDAEELSKVFSEKGGVVIAYPEREGTPISYGATMDTFRSIREGRLPKMKNLIGHQLSYSVATWRWSGPLLRCGSMRCCPIAAWICLR